MKIISYLIFIINELGQDTNEKIVSIGLELEIFSYLELNRYWYVFIAKPF